MTDADPYGLVHRDRHDSHAYRKLVDNQRAKLLPCWLCGQPINYRATNPNDPDAYSYDHAQPWSTHPALRYDPDNGRSAHQRCNKSRGNKTPAPGLGIASEKW